MEGTAELAEVMLPVDTENGHEGACALIHLSITPLSPLCGTEKIQLNEGVKVNSVA